jgi:diguanylate cyclase (GGDEF)-like protein
MPGMDGLEVCRRLAADESTRGVPVIFVTAKDEVGDETSGFDAGGVDYITKPISPPIVRARVRTHLELKEARDRLEALAWRDALTGVGNRRRFDHGLDHEWRRAERGAHWLSLALVDVDDFKKFNDHYGHGRGDECLRTVAHALEGACRRPSDLVARYGGEEFAVVLPETDPAGARVIVADILGRVREKAIEHRASRAGDVVSVSVGAVSLVPEGPNGARAAFEQVDQLLYEAKNGGRACGVHMEVGAAKTRIVAGDPTGGGTR